MQRATRAISLLGMDYCLGKSSQGVYDEAQSAKMRVTTPSKLAAPRVPWDKLRESHYK